MQLIHVISAYLIDKLSFNYNTSEGIVVIHMVKYAIQVICFLLHIVLYFISSYANLDAAGRTLKQFLIQYFVHFYDIIWISMNWFNSDVRN